MIKKIFICLTFFIIHSIDTLGQLTISPAASLNNIRWSHQSQLLANGNVIVFGGDNGYASSPWYYRSAEIYNPTLNTWVFTDSLHVTRNNMASVLLNNGVVMAIGGYNPYTGIITNTCEWYDPNTAVWTAAPSMINARQYHQAIKLANGKILVVNGGNNTCEIFDPLQQNWFITGNTNTSHGEGFTLTCLADGRVLAAGGQATGYNAEIYDPTTGVWTNTTDGWGSTTLMNGNREFHGAIMLNNGKVLIYGSSQSSDQLTCELFDPSSGSFTTTGALPINKAASPGLLLDDGTILTYGLGDFSQPSNTKVIDTYSSSSGIWSYNTYNFIGTQAYTINHIYTGELLIAGGSASSGNGASSQCLRITPAQGGSCVKPNQTLSLTNLTPSVCYGNGANVQVSSSENSVIYQALISGIKVGTFVADNGGNITLSIPSTSLAIGTNVVEIMAYYSGCNSVILNNTVTINVNQSNTSKPVVSAIGTSTFCAGGSVTLQTSSSSNGYVWCSGATTSSLTVTNSGYYYLFTQDISSCLSLPSDTIYVNVLPYTSTLSVGANQTTCTNNLPTQLIGAPVGGTWTGTGVSNTGLFTPMTAGSFYLVYHYCGYKDSLLMTVNAPPDITGFTINLAEKTACTGFTNNVSLANTGGAFYTLYLNGNYFGSGYGSSIIWYLSILNSTQDIKVVASLNSSCGTITATKYDTITIYNRPNAAIVAKCDTVCYGDSVTVTIVNSEVGVRYIAYNSNYNTVPISDTAIGNGSNLVIKLFSMSAGITLQINAINSHGCSATLGYTPITANRHDIPNFTTSITAGFIGDTVSFTNTSTGVSSYLWNINGVLSTAMVPPPITFDSTGIKKITLTGYTDIAGCIDSITQTVQIVLHSPANPGSVCSFDSLQESPNTQIVITLPYLHFML